MSEERKEREYTPEEIAAIEAKEDAAFDALDKAEHIDDANDDGTVIDDTDSEIVDVDDEATADNL